MNNEENRKLTTLKREHQKKIVELEYLARVEAIDLEEKKIRKETDQ